MNEMRDIALNICPVKFYNDNNQHEYWLGETQLQGITSTIIDWMFPDSYIGVNKHVLRQAATRGTSIHHKIRLLCELGISPKKEDEEYYNEIHACARLLAEKKLKPIANEYIVSNNTTHASAIDIVCDNGVLIDIKTTLERNVEKLSLQLSIYAAWFEELNPDVKVPALYCVWLPKGKDPELFEVKRIPTEQVNEIIAAYNRQDDNKASLAIMGYVNTLPAEQQEIIEKIELLEREVKEKTELMNKLKDGLCELFDEKGYRSFDNGYMKINYTPPRKQKRFDSTTFKKDNPDLYKQYQKDVDVKGSIRITIREE